MDAISNCLEMWHTEGEYKGASLYQLWLEYNKQAELLASIHEKQHQYVTPTG